MDGDGVSAEINPLILSVDSTGISEPIREHTALLRIIMTWCPILGFDILGFEYTNPLDEVIVIYMLY